MPTAKELLVMEEGDRRECQRIVRTRNTALSIARRAQMLLMAAQGCANRRIALQLGVKAHVVGRVRREYEYLPALLTMGCATNIFNIFFTLSQLSVVSSI